MMHCQVIDLNGTRFEMTAEEFEKRHRIRLVNKNNIWWARLIGRFSPRFLSYWWTTIRFPFCDGVIAFPTCVDDPMSHQFKDVRDHELIHVEQQRTAWGLFVSVIFCFFIPLPVIFSGRWFIERPAYLMEIRRGRRTVDSSVNTLWESYGWAWPKHLMRRWFDSQQ